MCKTGAEGEKGGRGERFPEKVLLAASVAVEEGERLGKRGRKGRFLKTLTSVRLRKTGKGYQNSRGGERKDAFGVSGSSDIWKQEGKGRERSPLS